MRPVPTITIAGYAARWPSTLLAPFRLVDYACGVYFGFKVVLLARNRVKGGVSQSSRLTSNPNSPLPYNQVHTLQYPPLRLYFNRNYYKKARNMTVIRVTEPQSVEKILGFIGGNFFSGDRLQRFIQTELGLLSSSAQINLSSLAQGGNRVTEVWGFLENDIPLGGITLNYYLWDRLAKQLYFWTIENEQGVIETIAVEPFSEIVSRKLNPVTTLQIAVELGYFAVAKNARGQGIGCQLFDTFIHQVKANLAQTNWLLRLF